MLGSRQRTFRAGEGLHETDTRTPAAAVSARADVDDDVGLQPAAERDLLVSLRFLHVERSRAHAQDGGEGGQIERHAEEIRNMQGTEQEKIDAMNRLDEERRELNEMQGAR